MVKRKVKKDKQIGGGATLLGNIGAGLASLNNSKFFRFSNDNDEYWFKIYLHKTN